MGDMDMGLPVPKKVLIIWPKIPEIFQTLSVQIVLPRPKGLDFNNTGKSLSEALIFVSTNPQYDNRLFTKIHEMSKLKPKVNLLCTEIVSAIQKIFVHNMFSPCPAKKKELLAKICL